MGIQAYFKIADLESAGVSVTFHEETHWKKNEESTGYEVDFIDKWASLEFPDGTEHGVQQANEATLWVDFNHWGSNRPILEPQFKALGISWREG